MAFGIRDAPDRPQALEEIEMLRELASGGKVAIRELAEPADGALAGAARAFIHNMGPARGRVPPATWAHGSGALRGWARSRARVTLLGLPLAGEP
jgi:ubiquinone/menaquinone biosynthesis C-methylase UbiE